MTDIATIGADFFRPHQGAVIALANCQGNVVLAATLLQIEDKPQATMRGAPRQAFTLTLVAPLPCDVESGHYTLGHPEFGAVGPVHVVRIMPADDRAWFGVYFS